MSDFWKKVLMLVLPVVVKIIEKILDIDINGDGEIC